MAVSWQAIVLASVLFPHFQGLALQVLLQRALMAPEETRDQLQSGGVCQLYEDRPREGASRYEELRVLWYLYGAPAQNAAIAWAVCGKDAGETFLKLR